MNMRLNKYKMGDIFEDLHNEFINSEEFDKFLYEINNFQKNNLSN